MTGEEARGRTIDGELALARECLQEARYAIEGGFFRLARSRAYYACFHTATAVFAAQGKAFRRHIGLQAAVDTELVKPGLVPPECAASLRRLYQARLRSDYGDIAPASRAEADQAVADAEKIVAVLTPLAFRAKDDGH
ncbi:MAG: HEPN domain-containing protein [Planctomycetia bacterium]|nr:HEPN domain-containing protein [Planctomycetia bacterium]